jgi:hypothetical protein
MKEAEPVDPSWDKKKREENKAKSLDGIISYLTEKYSGNVQQTEIVLITSKSVFSDDPQWALKNIADLPSSPYCQSKDEPGQWVCWDFRDMRVRPTHYTIRALWLRSWVVEGSLDDSRWIEIDRQKNNQYFYRDWDTVSFTVSNPVEFRFIRLTQTGKSHVQGEDLSLYGVEFFGTLSE